MTKCDGEMQISSDVARRTSYLWFETGVVLIICVIPHLFNSLAYLYLLNPDRTHTFLFHALSALVSSTESVVLILFIIWKSKEPIARFGLGRIHFSDLLWGIGMAEEGVIRAYLIPRFEELFESSWLAVFFSTALFASYHGYEGTVGVISAAIIGLVYGTSFCILRRFAPIAFAHALYDFLLHMHRI